MKRTCPTCSSESRIDLCPNCNTKEEIDKNKIMDSIEKGVITKTGYFITFIILFVILSGTLFIGCSTGTKSDKLRDEFDRHERYQEPKR